MMLKKVHRVFKFKQLPWLKTYIDLNTDPRKKATNKFDINLLKLMNNAVLDRTSKNPVSE